MVQGISRVTGKSCGQIVMKFSGLVASGTRNNQLSVEIDWYYISNVTVTNFDEEIGARTVLERAGQSNVLPPLGFSWF